VETMKDSTELMKACFTVLNFTREKEPDMFNIGDKVVCIRPLNTLSGNIVYTICEIEEEYVTVEGSSNFWHRSRFQKHAEQPSLANTKINVQAYADNYGLTLEQAHGEVQQFAFDSGYKWCTGERAICVVDSYGLFFSADKSFSKTGDPYYFQYGTTEKEITLSRTIQHAISFVEPPVKERERVTLNGKEYYKDELEKALSLIKPVSE
jgi:hypothetical protein